MANIVAPHKSRTSGGTSHSPDRRAPRQATHEKIISQRFWRISCLQDRLRRKTMTEKNEVELTSLVGEYPHLKLALLSEQELISAVRLHFRKLQAAA